MGLGERSHDRRDDVVADGWQETDVEGATLAHREPAHPIECAVCASEQRLGFAE